MYYAHSPKDEIPAQPYESHVQKVSMNINAYLSSLRKHSIDIELLRNCAIDAGFFHDLGKLEPENQAVLSGEKKAQSLPKNHVDAGTAYLLDKNCFSGATVYAHHIGFPNFTEEWNKGDSAFRDIPIKFDTDEILSELVALHNSVVAEKLITMTESPKGDLTCFMRMLLSLLADADHSDTAENYKQCLSYPDEIKLRPAERLKKLDEYVSKFKGSEERNILRREMYLECRNATLNSNINSCDSPVGSGKTTAIMAHLLSHAEKRGLRRIFVVLPFTNIIKQSVEIYRRALVLPDEDPEDIVAELHHLADFESKNERYLTSLWNAPIIITTAVAFFETLASNRPSTLRRLHRLPGSAIFIDESHAALPVKYLPLAWKWMNVFASDWNCYWVLASGSLNRFWEVKSISKLSECSRSFSVSEIVSDNLRKSLSVYERGRIFYKNDLQQKNTADLAKWITGFEGPRLVILNTIQSSAVLADYFCQTYGRSSVEHLSTALTPEDREKTLENVKRRLSDKNDDDWTLVATSCVEAGVDLSFKVGFRELCSFASLLQSSGRVNRSGDYTNAEIWTFCISEDGMLNSNSGIENSAQVLRHYLERNIEIKPELATQAIEDEIRLYEKDSIAEKLLKHECEQSFSLVEKEFKVIESDTRIAVVDVNISNEIQERKIDWRKLQKKSVQIAKYKLCELKIPRITEEIYYWNLGYDDFLGYMVGIINIKKLENNSMIF